jgi:hypothetical protein
MTTDAIRAMSIPDRYTLNSKALVVINAVFSDVRMVIPAGASRGVYIDAINRISNRIRKGDTITSVVVTKRGVV